MMLDPQELGVVETDRQVHAARCSPCGQYLFAGGFEGEVRRWDLDGEDSPELQPLAGHHGWVQGLAFHPTEKRLFTADSWGELRCWDYAADEPAPCWIQESAHDGWIRCLAVSPDGKLVASCGRDRRVRNWSTVDGKPQYEYTGHEHDVYNLTFSPDGKFLVSGDDRGVVKKWNVLTAECESEFDASSLYAYHRIQDVGGVRVLALDAAGKTLAVGGGKPSRGGTVQAVPTVLLFDFATGELQHTLELGKPQDCYVHDLVLRPDNLVIAVTSGTPGNGQIIFQRPTDEEPLFRSNKLANCHSIALHPDGRRFVVVATNKGSNGNGRRLDADGNYIGNSSPLHWFELT